MTREPHSLSEYEKVLNKAKSKYRDAVRGFEYQRVLITEFLSFHDSNLTDQQKVYDICQIYTSCVQIKLNVINKILKDFQWHRDLIGNASSHAGLAAQYQTEFQQAIDDVKKIKILYKESIKI